MFEHSIGTLLAASSYLRMSARLVAPTNVATAMPVLRAGSGCAGGSPADVRYPIHQTLKSLMPAMPREHPDSWYDGQTDWFDWALNSVGQPSLARPVPGELARSLMP
jgi:hypothetical protein